MSLRDLKRARTRQALVDAATRLFQERGYAETTIAQVTEAADVGARTFFRYFPSKEDLLFPESDLRVQAALDAIAHRAPGDGPVDVLLRALTTTGLASDDLVSPLAALRLRLIRSVPAVRGKALQLQLDAQRAIATHLAEAFDMDPVRAAALTGAFVGATEGALEVLLDGADLDDPAVLHHAVQAAVAAALEPWRRPPSGLTPSSGG